MIPAGEEYPDWYSDTSFFGTVGSIFDLVIETAREVVQCWWDSPDNYARYADVHDYVDTSYLDESDDE